MNTIGGSLSRLHSRLFPHRYCSFFILYATHPGGLQAIPAETVAVSSAHNILVTLTLVIMLESIQYD